MQPATQARLVRVRTDAGEAAWDKRHHAKAGAARERAAYNALARLQGSWLPRLIAFNAATSTLTLSHVAGRSGAGSWSRADVALQMRALGRFRGALDRVDVAERDPMPLADAMGARREAWLMRGEALLPRREREGLAALIDPSAFVGQQRRWCHRDLRPDNWIAERDEGADVDEPDHVVVIDLGQARPDAAEVDVAKLLTDVWWPAADHGPALAAAFFAGWGVDPREPARQHRIIAATALHALCTRVWAGHHGDAAAAVRASRWIRALLDRHASVTDLLENHR